MKGREGGIIILGSNSLPTPEKIVEKFKEMQNAREKKTIDELSQRFKEESANSLGMYIRSLYPSKNLNVLHFIAKGQISYHIFPIIYPHLSLDMFNYLGEKGNTPLLMAINTGELKAFNLLIEYQTLKLKSLGYDKNQIKTEIKHTVNIKNLKGQTPLHIAGYHHRIEQINILLSLGADPLAKDGEGNTPAHLAAKYPLSGREAIKLLLAAGVTSNIKNNNKQTVLDLAHANIGAELISEVNNMFKWDEKDDQEINKAYKKPPVFDEVLKNKIAKSKAR